MGINLSPLDIAGLVYIGLTLIVLIFVYLLLKKFIKYLWRIWSNDNMFGSDLKIKLLSLGIVALMFPNIFYAVGDAIIYFMRYFFADLPRDLITNWQTIQTYCQHGESQFGESNFSFCASQLGYGFVEAWASTFSASLNRFSPTYIPYNKLILLLAVWAGISMLLGSAVSSEHGQGSHHRSRLQTGLDGLSTTTKKNITFFLVLIVAVYLSIAAITAIPGLEESAAPSDNVSEEKLKSQLEDAYKLTFDRIPAQILFLESLPTPSPTIAPVSSEPGEKVNISQGNSEDNQFIKYRREIWQSNYSTLLRDVQKQAESSKTSALSRYQASIVERKGSKETIRHFLDIDAWYQEEFNKYRNSTCSMPKIHSRIR